MIDKDDIQNFINKLRECLHKSDWDVQFINNYDSKIIEISTDENLVNHYKDRLGQLASSSFDLTLKFRTINNVWYQFIQTIAADMVSIIFPEIDIAEQDRRSLNQSVDFTDLYYNDDRTRVMSINHAIKQEIFSSYDNNVLYPLSLNEALQIRNKKESVVILGVEYTSRWAFICNNLLQQRANSTFEDVLYLLFNCVDIYFKNLDSSCSDVSKEIRENLQLMYTQELKFWAPETVLSFYAQKVELEPNNYVYMIDVLLDCLESNNQNQILEQMLALAKWISVQDPSMLIKHNSLDNFYNTHQFGPYFNLINLKAEIDQLLEYTSELDADSIQAIKTLSSVLVEPNRSFGVELFEQIVNLYKIRCHYNQTIKLTKEAFRTLVSTHDYPYHMKGINLQLIRIARLLAGSGWLQSYGKMEGYDRLLFPFLDSDYDNVSGQLLSYLPLSHKVVPESRDHLIIIDNSVENYNSSQIFENVNANPQRPYTVNEFERIQNDSAAKFRCREYVRIAEYPLPPLRVSTLNALIALINNSLYFRALNDNYKIQYVANISLSSQDIKLGIIYISIINNMIHYSVRDVWSISDVHCGMMPAQSEKLSFFELSDDDKLKYLIRYSSSKGHTRPNYHENSKQSGEHYLQACIAYTLFKEFYDVLESEEKSNLNKVKMRLNNSIYNFSEVYANGFPICMTSASRWFSILVMSYLPTFKFSDEIERQSQYLANDFLGKQRHLASLRKHKPEIIHNESDEVLLSENMMGLFHKRKNEYDMRMVTFADKSLHHGAMKLFSESTIDNDSTETDSEDQSSLEGKGILRSDSMTSSLTPNS